MKRLTVGFLSLFLISALPVQAQRVPVVLYKCDQGKTFQAQFQQRAAVISLGRNSIRLPQIVSASGANYSNQTYRLFTKGKRAFLSINNQLVYRNCLAQTAMNAFSTVTGTVTYRERIALPLNAVVVVELQDVSRMDAPAIVLDRQTIPVTNQVPIPFTLRFDPQKIEPQRIYAVRAQILVNGQLRFINTSMNRVITQGNPSSNVEILVQPVGRSPQ